VRTHLPIVDRGGTVVFTVAATTATPDLESIVAELVLRGDWVVAVVVDDRSFHPISLEQQMRRAKGRSFDEVVAGLARAGAVVYTLDKTTDPRSELESAGASAAASERAGRAAGISGARAAAGGFA
jgi:hypothetical protein